MMKAEKQVIGHIEKCYAVGRFFYDGKDHLVCSAEKDNPCYVFDYSGEKVDTLWDGPGGVMTLQQYPYAEKIMMATQKFYSPNNSAEAKIVYYTEENGKWNCHVLCDLPFVHRFGIIERNHVKYLVACTLKSAHAFKDDWTCPGRIWAAKLPEDIREYSAEHQLKMTPLVSGLYKNHGFFKGTENDYEIILAGTENGIIKVVPPETEDGDWKCEKILDQPTSDMVYLDFDGDGEKELLTLSPFHGDTLSVYKKQGEVFAKVWEYPEKLPFLHAIWGQYINGKAYAFVGNREAERDFFAVSYDKVKGSYTVSLLDKGAGAANCLFYTDGDKNKLIAANRETDEIALYTLNFE